MVFVSIARSINRGVMLGVLAFVCAGLVVAGCQVSPTPTNSPLLIVPTATPLPVNRCDTVSGLAPNRTPLPHPTYIPIPTTTPQASLATARSDLVDVKFYSRLLEQEMPALVYLPPGYYDTDRRYPTLYLLSGFAGDYREWATYGICQVLDVLIRGGATQPMIVVMPEGEKSWWFNHAPVAGSDGKPYGDYTWHDVVGFADATFRTLPHRESRAIGGLSAGGQSALMLALTHPEIFSIAGAHSPSIRGADGSIAYFGTPEYFKQYDPLWLLKNTNTWKEISIWIDMGHEDTQWGSAIEELHQTMDTLGVAHEFHDTWVGKHEGDYWSAHLSDYLLWYASKLAGE